MHIGTAQILGADTTSPVAALTSGGPAEEDGALFLPTMMLSSDIAGT